MKTLIDGFTALTTPSKIAFFLLPLIGLIFYIVFGTPPR